jgi:glycosidase
MIKFAASSYLLKPGNPFVYYGEEIGMINYGSSNDENKRGPMFWSNNLGQNTLGPINQDPIEYFFPSVNTQSLDNTSILSTYKRLMKIRNQNPEIARGTPELILNNSNATDKYDNLVSDNLVTLKLSYNGHSVYVIQNFARCPIKISKSDLGFDYSQIRGYLASTGEAFIFENNDIYFPAFSTLIVK